MNKTKTTIASKKDASTLVRAVFGPGMLLQSDDLEQLNAYTRDLSRLLFRSFFGCGVVCGLVVIVGPPDCGKQYVTVGAGLALDCSGDPIYVPVDEKFVLDENCDPNLPDPLWVVLCRTQKCCAPRTSMCTCDGDGATSECTRERDCFEIRVVSILPECICGCSEKRLKSDSFCKCVNPEDKCYEDHYAGKCGCSCEDGSSCDCTCVVLAKLCKQTDPQKPWGVDHGVRRFIRPVLMRDPQVEAEREQQQKNAAKKQATIEKQLQMERHLEQSAQREDELRTELRKRSEQAEALQEELVTVRKEEGTEHQKREDEKKPKQPKAAKKEGG